MTPDTRSPMERRFIFMDHFSYAGGTLHTVRVGDRFIKGLTREQAAEMMECVRAAQRVAVQNTQREMRVALGLENER